MFQWNARLAGVIAVTVALASALGDWAWLSWGW
jgi:hypothetical protein